MNGDAYYNEHDEYAAQWLRNLIDAGHIAAGVVDERSIEDVHPRDLDGFVQCHFFAGIGVWSYALRLAGWPDDRPVWTGSCPCQPFSAAGKGAGFADERHLWPAWHHLIRECRPAVVFGEQVASKDGLGWLDLVHADLEAEGYAVGAADLCAAGVGAPHIRQRLWFVGHADDRGGRRHAGAVPSHGVESTGAVGIVADHGGGRCKAVEQHRTLVSAPRGESRSGRESAVPPLRGRELGGLANAQQHDRGREAAAPDHAGTQTDGPADRIGGCRRASGVPADTDGRHAGAERQQRSREHGQQPQDGGAVRGFWSDADWIPCRDGKARPVEPGTFPLAHGAPARVGRLRAYGNAIVGPLAAEFVGAYLDVKAAA